jgi:transposase
LKDPLFIDNVYLKNQDRVYALGFVFLFALLIASLIELKARRVLQERQEEIEVHGGRRQSRPTIVSLLEVLNELFIMVEYTGRGIRRWADPDTDPRALKILEILGYGLSLYLKPA